MGRGVFIAAAALAVALAGTGEAAEARAIQMMDGPGASGRSLGAVWAMSCPPQARLAGIRLYEDAAAIVGVEALCVRLRQEGGVTAWAGRPAVAEMPEPATPVPDVPEAEPVVEASHVLRASSDGVSRFSGSRALLITVSRRPEATRVAGASRISFEDGGRARDVVCPEGGYVQGVRTGTGRRSGGLAAIQLICTRDGNRTVSVGGWGEGRRADGAPLVAARTQCGGGVANPHDGVAGRALIGAVEDGRIVSLGLLCARAAVPGPLSEAAEAARRWLAGLAPAPRAGARAVYRAPQWYAGSAVAVCRDGSGRGYCAQASADRFCTTMRGSGAATFYVVGPYAEDAIAAGGKRCPAGACRAFRSITCAG